MLGFLCTTAPYVRSIHGNCLNWSSICELATRRLQTAADRASWDSMMRTCLCTVTHDAHRHSLPVFGPEYQSKEATAETAFNGVLRIYEIVNNTADRDLESFILNQRSAIATLIEQRLSQGPQKVQFAVKVVIEAASR